ncbi:hypothetical protein [Methylosinus sp. PW1]|uniref:hypothetical protein n=1 Tax=Methylosinus sp. PW1 TaxID=107636 RepID=UPI00055E4D62|nr:hypothetical protein [Methylosinus sp. PW1]
MLYNFDTHDDRLAAAALVLYAAYKSRDRRRFAVSTDMWDRIERFVKDAAKRSRTLPAFVEALKPRLCCGSISPRWLSADPFDAACERRGTEFLSHLLERHDGAAVVRKAYDETACVVLLVRDRLEREKPVESNSNDAINVKESV